MESVYWLKDKGVHFDRSFVDMPVGALWRRGHKPMKAQGLEYIENLGDTLNIIMVVFLQKLLQKN